MQCCAGSNILTSTAEKLCRICAHFDRMEPER